MWSSRNTPSKVGSSSFCCQSVRSGSFGRKVAHAAKRALAVAGSRARTAVTASVQRSASAWSCGVASLLRTRLEESAASLFA